VTAQTASLTKVDSFAAEADKYLRTGYEDVEDWGLLVCTFSDGTLAEIVGGDTTLGGVRNRMTVYGSRVVVEANLNPNTAVRAYAPDASVLAGAYLSEKLETHGGWSSPAPDEDWMPGHPQEMQDFAEALAHGRAAIGRDTRSRRARGGLQRVRVGRGGSARRPHALVRRTMTIESRGSSGSSRISRGPENGGSPPSSSTTSETTSFGRRSRASASPKRPAARTLPVAVFANLWMPVAVPAASTASSSVLTRSKVPSLRVPTVGARP